MEWSVWGDESLVRGAGMEEVPVSITKSILQAWVAARVDS